MKEHQKVVAKLAKNDTDDLDEITGRRDYDLLRSYNKFTRRSMIDQTIRNEVSENTLLSIKKILVLILS